MDFHYTRHIRLVYGKKTESMSIRQMMSHMIKQNQMKKLPIYGSIAWLSLCDPIKYTRNFV
jgi:hypothetical protein